MQEQLAGQFFDGLKEKRLFIEIYSEQDDLLDSLPSGKSPDPPGIEPSPVRFPLLREHFIKSGRPVLKKANFADEMAYSNYFFKKLQPDLK